MRASVPRLTAGRISGFLLEGKDVAAAAADHVSGRIAGGALLEKTDRHLVQGKARVGSAWIVILGNLGKPGIAAPQAFQLS